MIIVNNFEELKEAVSNIEFPEVNYVDNGIGAYEYWGSKGVDRQMEWEIEGDEVKIQINFEDTEDELEFVIEDLVFDAQDSLYKYLNGYNEDVDFSDIVCLDYDLENNILTLDWKRC